MKTNWRLAIGIAPLAMLLLAGCGTALPVKWYVRRGPAYNDTMPTVDRIGLVVDAAVSYDRVGTNNNFNIEDSLAAIKNLINETQSDLKAKGYEVAFLESPFVAAFKTPDTVYLVAQARKGQPSERRAPFLVADELNADPDYRDGLLKASRLVHQAVQNRGELPTEQLRSDETVRQTLSAIAAKKNVRYLLLVQGDGTIVSGGKQVGQEIGTILLSSVISFGTVVASAHNLSTLDSYVSLIDLNEAEVLWCNSLRLGGLNPANSEHYKRRWAHNVLYWLPPRGKLEPPPPK